MNTQFSGDETQMPSKTNEEKCFGLTSHQWNVNSNYTEILPHSSQNDSL